MSIAQDNKDQSEHWVPEHTKIINGKPVRFRDVCVHEIRMGDVEDPDLFVAEPIWRWQQTPQGKFIMETAEATPYWTRQFDHTNFGHKYLIIARLSEQNETWWRLKWGGFKK